MPALRATRALPPAPAGRRDDSRRSARWRTLRPLALAAVVAAPAVAPAVAGAQQSPRDSTVRRDSTARRDSAATLLPAVQVRASIAPTAGTSIGSGTPARISTISGRAIEAWEPRLLPDVLSTQPGVSFYDDLGTPSKLNLTTRGFNVGPTVGLPPGVSVFLDGVRQNEPDAQQVYFDLLPLEHVRHIELLSGSASLLGANSLGGAINLVTAHGEGPPSGEIELSAASFGGRSAEGTIAGRTDGGTSFYASSGYEREGGWREATGARSYSGFMNLGRTGPRRGATLQAYAATSRAETAGSLPETLFEASPRANFTVGDFDDLSAQQLALAGYAPAGAGHGSVTAYVRRSRAERFNVNQVPDPDVRARTTNVTAGGTADWRVARAAGPGALALRLGVDGAANRVRARIYAEAGAGGEAIAQSLTTDVRSPSWDVAGYALADFQVGRVTFSGGGRYDFTRIPFRNQVDTSDNTTNDYRRFSPRAGVSLALGQGASLYASAGGSFRPPAILELGCADPEATCPLPFALGEDPPLAPVKATTYEAGGRWAAGPLVATASAYRTNVRDEIFFVASEAALFSGYFTNLERTRREGVELAVEGTGAGGRLDWYGNYAFTRATFQSPAELFSIRSGVEFAASPLAGENAVVPGRRLPLVPAHQAKAGALVRLGSGLELGLDARYIGRQWFRGDEANETEPLDGYALLNARVGYSVAGWEVAAIGSNVFDSHAAVFGTFNENRQTGELERFLTPLNARAVKLIVSREIGRGAGREER